MRLISLRGDERRTMTIGADQALRAAMQIMNESGRTFVLVTDDHERLLGVVADGDIRRHLARGGDVDEPVTVALNTTPITLDDNTPSAEVRAFMVRRGLAYLPLLDGERVAVLCILEHAPRASDLSAVILAGGLGARLSPLTDECPKPLLPLCDKPILSHIMDHLREQGIHRFVLSLNYLANMIVDHYDDGSRWDCFIDYVHETQRLGTGGPLSLVDREALSDPFLVMNGDVLNDIDIAALRDTHLANGWDATMAVRDFHHTIPYGVVDTADDGEFVGLREKPVQSFLINTGIYMLSKPTLDLIPHEQFYDMPSLFSDLSSHGLRSGTYEHAGRWIDIGTTTEYDRAKAIFSEGGAI